MNLFKLIIFSLLVPLFSLLNCFTPLKYPRLFGGTNGDTEFTCLDVDGNGNIAVGGTSSDDSIVKNTN